MDIVKFYKDGICKIINEESFNELMKENTNYEDFKEMILEFPPDCYCGIEMMKILYKIEEFINSIDQVSKLKDEQEYLKDTIRFMLREWNLICYG